MRDALITVKGIQYIDNGKDVIELKTLGKYGIKNDKYYIKYSQTDENGAVTDTLIKVSDDETVLQRSGDTNSRMVIEVGKRNSSSYSSAGAGLLLDVYGEVIDNKLTECGGKLELEYSLSINAAPISRNKIEITVKEV